MAALADCALRQSRWLPLDTGLCPGERVCAIGDVHGCTAQFTALMDHFEAGCESCGATRLVLTGDLTDRGPDSIGAIDAAIAARDRAFDELIPLMGNHEQMLRLAMGANPADGQELWLMNGGETVLLQLGIPFERGPGFACVILPESGDAAARVIANALGPERIGFLESLTSHRVIGKLLFVHAGTDPGCSLQEHFAQPWDQAHDRHWTWIRSPFLMTDHPVPGLTVVHGHSPVDLFRFSSAADDALSPHYQHNGKLNLDAGSFRSGLVAAAEFVAGKYRVTMASGVH